MRRTINVAALLLALAIGAACSATPSRRYVQMADTYAATVNTTADLVRAGKINPIDGRRIQAFSKLIRAKLDEFKDAIAAGQTVDKLTAILDLAHDLLRQLAIEVSVAQAADKES